MLSTLLDIILESKYDKAAQVCCLLQMALRRLCPPFLKIARILRTMWYALQGNCSLCMPAAVQLLLWPYQSWEGHVHAMQVRWATVLYRMVTRMKSKVSITVAWRPLYECVREAYMQPLNTYTGTSYFSSNNPISATFWSHFFLTSLRYTCTIFTIPA